MGINNGVLEMGDEGTLPVEFPEARNLSPLTESQAIRIAARLGVWGTLVGCGSILAVGSGLSIPGAIAAALIPAGLIGGGLGLTATGALVARAGRRIARRVFAGALATIPLGLSILVLGLDSLSATPGPRGMLEFATAIMVLSAAVLGVLLGSGVWSALRAVVNADEDAPGAP